MDTYFSAIEAFVDYLNRDRSDPLFSWEGSKRELIDSVIKLERSLGFRLFDDIENPSTDTLSEPGKAFFPYAVTVVSELRKGIIESYNAQSLDCNKLILNTSLTFGRNVVIPCVSDLLLHQKLQGIDVEILAYEEGSDDAMVQSHVVIRPLCNYDLQFFDRKWSYVVEQGLYASGEYLKDVGEPSSPDELKDHSVLGCARSFYDGTVWDENWHLSGKYGLPPLKASIIMNCKTVLASAVHANLGIGPIAEGNKNGSYGDLKRILPWISGPDIHVGFAVRKGLSKDLRRYVDVIEQHVISYVKGLGLRIIED